MALSEVSRAGSPPARASVIPLATTIAGNNPRTLGLLAMAAGLALLIAFGNFAGLLFVRSIDRRQELNVRSALGAGRSELVKQLLLEAGALAVCGTAAGVLLAIWATPAVGRLAVQ